MKRKPTLHALSRRTFMRLVGAGAAIGTMACRFDIAETTAVASTFETTHDSTILWFYSSDLVGVEFRLYRDDGTEVLHDTVVLDEESQVGAVLVESLEPKTNYHYRIEGVPESGIYRFRTTPAPDDAAPVRIGFSGDYDPHPRFKTNIMATLAAESLDVFFGLGDFPYCDNAPAPLNLDEFRWRHELARCQPDFQELMRSTSVCAMYDDHELADGWNRNSVATLTEFSSAGLAAWYEWFPQRHPDGYRSMRMGKNVHVIVLDSRLHRDEIDIGGDVLGSEQERWLKEELEKSEAPFVLVAMPSPLNSRGQDDWSHYPEARERLLQVLASATGKVFVLSADAHYFAARQFDSDIWEFQVGPLARSVGDFRPEVPEDVARAFIQNAGVIEVTGGDDPKLRFRSVDPDGALLYEQVFKA